MKSPKMLDNKGNGSVVDELVSNINIDLKLSVISAYFTIYAYAELKKELSKIDGGVVDDKCLAQRRCYK